MQKLLLHIGTHKTGTTSIQRFLSSNRAALRGQGLWYPGVHLGGHFRRHYAHHRVAHAIAGEGNEGTRDDAKRFFDAVRKGARPEETVLISAEPLYRHVLPLDAGATERRLMRGGEVEGDPLPYIRAVREVIGEFDVTVMVMLRRQDLFIESLYSEQIMSRDYVDDVNQFLAERMWLADYESRLADWASVFGEDRIQVRVFEPKLLGMPLERYFIEWCGASWDEKLSLGSDNKNVTVPRDLVEYKRVLNARWDRVANATTRRWLEELAAAAPQRLSSLGKYYLAPAVRADLMARFAESNRRIAERYCGRTDLFRDNELPEYPKPATLTEQKFIDITRMLVNRLARQAQEG